MINITILDKRWYKYSGHLRKLAAFVVDKREINLCILLANDDILRKLNNMYRNIDKATNVLSFSDENYANIALAYDYIRKEDFNFKERIELLLVHGMLHTFGYDHLEEEDAIIMENLEDWILNQFSIHIKNT